MTTSVPLDVPAAIDHLMNFLSVEGVTGHEANIAAAVSDALKSVGVPASAIRFDDANKRIPLPTETGNLIVDLPGTRPGPRLLFSTHLDTVPLCAGVKPRREGDRIVSDGTTALGNMERRKKYDLRIECYGTLDEANAVIGIARLHVGEGLLVIFVFRNIDTGDPGDETLGGIARALDLARQRIHVLEQPPFRERRRIELGGTGMLGALLKDGGEIFKGAEKNRNGGLIERDRHCGRSFSQK